MRTRTGCICALAALALLPGGCVSDHSEEALAKARAFTLDHTRMLPETARDYIRYTAPSVQTGNIFPHRGMPLTEYAHLPRNIDYRAPTDPNLDLIVADFVWNPPGADYSVIAAGRSRRDLGGWEPLKVILKTPVPVRQAYEKARAAAAAYVTDNMLYLSVPERNRVRHSEAEVRETAFNLEYMFEEQLESSADEWKRFLDMLKKKRASRQYAVVWRADDAAKRIVVVGFGSASGLDGWTPAVGMNITTGKLDEYTLEIQRKGPAAKGAETTGNGTK